MSKKLPEGWRRLSLSELGKIYTGNTPPTKKEEFYISNDVMFIKPDDFIQGKINIIGKSKAYLSKVGAEKGRFIPKGSVLITCIGILGKVGIIDEDCCFNQQINAIVPNLNIVIPKYLAYYIMNNKHILESMAGGAVVPMINKTQFSSIKIDLPPLEEQARIVSILEKAESAIEKRKESIKLIDEYLKSVFVDMFGDPVINTKNWNIKKLGELGYFKNGMNYKQSDSGFNIKFLGVGEFKYGNIINNSNMLPILELQEQPKDEYLLKDGDIVFVRSNGSKELVGRSVLIKGLEEDTTYSGFCIRYRNQNNEIMPEFLSSLFSDEGFKSYFKKDSRGANINNLNQQMLSDLNIIIPPIELQNKFTDFVKQVNKLKFEMENSLKELENNFNSLMQKAFNGEL
ncbi:restriction endonuclease subunit S [Paraclostridium sp. AKS81]|uniref:restriction endonuclease subunit S n=1 Tax=Paraclostridium sp. AKS81 TaxID=2876117 RepID=UPI0021E0C20E|nr:restriction endonuclease subunit S [Paraclostridium sp. AKS81]MCU9813346.1 restriction endonuclease subunit S [Paraclostridium sp. AKS81]